MFQDIFNTRRTCLETYQRLGQHVLGHIQHLEFVLGAICRLFKLEKSFYEKSGQNFVRNDAMKNKLGQRQSQTPFSRAFWVQKNFNSKKFWVKKISDLTCLT